MVSWRCVKGRCTGTWFSLRFHFQKMPAKEGSCKPKEVEGARFSHGQKEGWEGGRGLSRAGAGCPMGAPGRQGYVHVYFLLVYSS
jgi:hypothetical protein